VLEIDGLILFVLSDLLPNINDVESICSQIHCVQRCYSEDLTSPTLCFFLLQILAGKYRVTYVKNLFHFDSLFRKSVAGDSGRIENEKNS
jgi:hypothetical protein